MKEENADETARHHLAETGIQEVRQGEGGRASVALVFIGHQ